MPGPMPGPDAVPRLARPFAGLLLAAMLASAVFVWEPWPLTSFRLFSHLRTERQSSWRAVLVDDAGHRLRYELGSSVHGVRHFSFLMAEFVASGDARRTELCRAWIDAAPEISGHEARAVLLLRRHWHLLERVDDRALPGAEEHVYTCTRRRALLVD